MSYETWLTWGIPGVALLFAVVGFSIAWLGARDFDPRYERGPK